MFRVMGAPREGEARGAAPQGLLPLLPPSARRPTHAMRVTCAAGTDGRGVIGAAGGGSLGVVFHSRILGL